MMDHSFCAEAIGMEKATDGDHHCQVMLEDLGFSVDEGMEELIRALWAAGYRTNSCCIGNNEKRWRPGRGAIHVSPPDGYVGFLSEVPPGWTVSSSGYYPVFRFYRDEIPQLARSLR